VVIDYRSGADATFQLARIRVPLADSASLCGNSLAATSLKTRLRQRTSARVRHCLRRSRESDAQLRLAQLSVATSVFRYAEYVTRVCNGRIPQRFATKRPFLSMSANPSGLLWAASISRSNERGRRRMLPTCARREATKLNRPDQCTSGRSRLAQEKHAFRPCMKVRTCD